MQNFILVLSTTILSILPNNLSANDIPISRGDVYIHEISKNDYDNKIAYKNNFSGRGKLKLHAYTLSRFGRKKGGFLPKFEGRINLEHLA